jgi:hypothetical protein
MTAILILVVAFGILLAVEWVRRSAPVRIATIALALAVFFFFLPMPHRAMREVIGLRGSARIDSLPNWGHLSDYASGVLTMKRAVEADIGMDADKRLLAVGVLVWLAISPVVRRTTGPIADASTSEPVA